MSKKPKTTRLMIVLLIILLAYVGAISGLLIGRDEEQPWLWLGVGSLVGILVGALVSFAFTRTAKPENKKPSADDKNDTTARKSLHEARPVLTQVLTSDGIPVSICLFLAYGSDVAQTARNGAATPAAPDPHVHNLVVAAVTAATTQTVIQQAAHEVFAAEASKTLATAIVDAANAMLTQWEQQVSYLIIENIALPDEIRTAGLAQWIQNKEAEIERQSDAVRIQMQQKLISVLDHAYAQAKATSPKKRKQYGQVLAQVLIDIKSQAAPKGMWPDTLEDLLSGIA